MEPHSTVSLSDSEIKNPQLLLGIGGVCCMVLLLVALSFSESPELKSGWIQGLLGLAGFGFAGLIALQEIKSHKEREKTDRLVKIKREAYLDLINTVGELSWMLQTMWREKDPFLCSDKTYSSAALMRIHFVGGTEEIKLVMAAMDYYNQTLEEARRRRVPMEQAMRGLESQKVALEHWRSLRFEQNRLPSPERNSQDYAELSRRILDSLEAIATLEADIQRRASDISEYVKPRNLHFLWLMSRIIPSARESSELRGKDFEENQYRQLVAHLAMNVPNDPPSATPSRSA